MLQAGTSLAPGLRASPLLPLRITTAGLREMTRWCLAQVVEGSLFASVQMLVPKAGVVAMISLATLGRLPPLLPPHIQLSMAGQIAKVKAQPGLMERLVMAGSLLT